MASLLVVHVTVHDKGVWMVALATDILPESLVLVLETLVQQIGMAPDQDLAVVGKVDELPGKMMGVFPRGSDTADQTLRTAFGKVGLPVKVETVPAWFDQEVILYLQWVALDLKLEPE